MKSCVMRKTGIGARETQGGVPASRGISGRGKKIRTIGCEGEHCDWI